jgi:hypothetical protein
MSRGQAFIEGWVGFDENNNISATRPFLALQKKAFHVRDLVYQHLPQVAVKVPTILKMGLACVLGNRCPGLLKRVRGIHFRLESFVPITSC